VEGKVISRAKRLIYTTDEEMRLATSASTPSSKGIVITLGSDAPPATNPDVLGAQFLDKFPKAKGRTQLLFMGRVDFKKGLDRILLILPVIVKRHPDVLLTIAGSGSAEFKRKLDMLIAAADLRNHVLFTGWLDGRLKWGAYASATVFLLPSRQENFAITVAEAMRMGVPVIISNRVNTWPFVAAAGAGVVLDDQEINRELENSILLLLQCSDARQQMSEYGREYARQRLTWPHATRKLLDCYHSVLAST
jgi:glycosyltransferase involved in cell wall biosynthesis